MGVSYRGGETLLQWQWSIHYRYVQSDYKKKGQGQSCSDVGAQHHNALADRAI